MLNVLLAAARWPRPRIRRRADADAGACCPRPVGWFDRHDGDPAADFERQKRFTPFTAMYNITGQPAISLPLYQSREGLPIGDDARRPARRARRRCCRLAAQLEAALPWRDRHPPIWTA